MKIVGEDAKTEFLIQRATFFSNSDYSGFLECPHMVETPNQNIFIFHPFNLRIRVTLKESKQPEFQIIERT